MPCPRNSHVSRPAAAGSVGWGATLPCAPVTAWRALFVRGGLTQGEMVLCLLEQSGIRPVIGQVFPFESAREAFKYMENGSHFGKIVIGIGMQS